ncbi:hypothetical protein HGRIS_002451 [Hohenbuehelia grisea]|uniref:Uncharacterized protein n=1 Tax=Hohenbuehelia grisea TaxID=104357 RepID=A0ABR3JKH9_9AGAR
MDGSENGSAKRRKVMLGPDGFTNAKPKPASKARVQPPSFISEFGGPTKSSLPSASKPISGTKGPKSNPPARTIQPMDIGLMHSCKTGSAPRRPISLPKPSVPHPSGSPPSSRAAALANVVTISRVVGQHGAAETSGSSTTELRRDSLKACLPRYLPFSEREAPQNQILQPRRLADESLKTSGRLKPLAPPHLRGMAEADSASPRLMMKSAPLKPPRIEEPPNVERSSDTSLRTITSTRVARATDLSTSDGATELLSIILQDRKDGGDSLVETDVSTDTLGGVDFSPSKSSRKGGPKFLKGKLAERANALLTQSHASMSLWQKELELQQRSSSRLVPDLQLYIAEILHLPKLSSSRVCGLAWCSPNNILPPIAASAGTPPSTFMSGLRLQRPSHAGTDAHLVLFSFYTPLFSSLDVGIRSAAAFHVGRRLMAWRPWYEVLLDAPAPFTFRDGSKAEKILLLTRFVITTP